MASSPSPSPPPLVIVGGPCGSGKTTVGRALADRLGYRFVDADDFHSAEAKQKMARGEPLTDEERVPWLQRVASCWIEEPDVKFVVACSALKRTHRSALLASCCSPRKALIVLLAVPREELLRRVEARHGHYAKRNLIDSQMAALEMPSSSAPVDEPQTLTVDGERTVAQIVAEIVEKIGRE